MARPTACASAGYDELLLAVNYTVEAVYSWGRLIVLLVACVTRQDREHSLGAFEVR